MIHGIYLKNRPKGKWHLFSISISIEAAVSEVGEAIKQAKSEGHDNPEAAIQVFNSTFHIPQFLSEVKTVDSQALYN